MPATTPQPGTETTGLLDRLGAGLPDFLPFAVTAVLVVLALWAVDIVTRRRAAKASGEAEFSRQLSMLGLTLLGVVLAAIALPNGVRGDVLSLIGIALTAALTLSSTTFVSNAMAGVMLRAMRSFGPGDFIEVEEHFGRVTERRLLHTEIQTEHRDLVTLPNYYLITKSLKVVRRSGTIVSAAVSIGYDEPHDKVCEALRRAGEACGLKEPFAHVTELGNFSVSYKAAGFLEDVTQLISTRSSLRRAMLDALHADEIEILSPTYMVQRPQTPGDRVVADALGPTTEAGAERIMFDKAELAGRVEEMRREREAIHADIAELEKGVGSVPDTVRSRMQRGLDIRKSRLETLDHQIERFERELRERE